MTDQNTGPGGPFDGGASLDQMMEDYLRIMRQFLAKTPADADLQEDIHPDAKEREIVMHLARAQMMWLNRGLTLWRRIGETMIAHGEEAKAAAPDDLTDANARTQKRLIALDKARACLHEVGDMTRISAQEFQQELIEIEAALRASQAPEPYDKPKRRARAKR